MLRFELQTCAILLVVILLLATPAGSLCASEVEVSTDRPAEYMIYQYPEVSLVVVVDVPEAEFDLQIFGPENALISESGVSSRRIGPVFHLIDAVDKPRQLMIKVSPNRRIGRSRIKMELIQLSEYDRNARFLVQAYKLFSNGTQQVYTKDTPTWTAKVYSLRSAAQAFAEMGMEEMSLWSEFYAAHLILYRLGDKLSALEVARVIQVAAGRAGFETVELAAAVLEGEALMLAASGSSGPQSAAYYERTHEVLDRLAKLSEQLDYRSEHARALYQEGLAYEKQGYPDRAIERYRRALDISATSENPELVNEIRGTAASAYETLGSTSGAIEMLEHIAGDLATDPENNTALELADNLAEKGRLLNDSYRYREAGVELSRALYLKKSSAASEPWGPTGLGLAWSQYSLGYMEQAVSLIEESLPRTPHSGNREALIRAYGVLASVGRLRQQFDVMDNFRDRQGSVLETGSQQARYLFEKGMDAWQRDGSGSGRAAGLLRQSRQAAGGNGDLVTENRARLYLCLLELERGGHGNCSNADARTSFNALQKSGIPRIAADAAFAYSRILRRNGKLHDALENMNRLIGDIHFFRQRLPGVLGAWYWENKADIFREYLSLTLAASGAGNREAPDGGPTLLALERVRMLENSANMDTGNGQAESLRSLLSRREGMLGTQIPELSRQADEELRAFKAAHAPVGVPLNGDVLDQLLAHLERDEAILSYYFSGDAVYALPGNRDGVRLIRLSGPEQITSGLESLRFRHGRPVDRPLLSDLEALGSLMLEPIAGHLADRIYLMPSGPLNGIPFDALRLEGAFLAENHQLVNLLSLASIGKAKLQMQADFRDHVFLAGSPQQGQELFSYGVSSTAEIGAVRDRFVGPGLHMVQGVALQRDEFLDTRFSQAALIHLAIPGTVDLVFPDRSRLMLSGTRENPAVETLGPVDVRILNLTASLVVLSGTAFIGQSGSMFDSRLGFITDFHESGVGSVVATLWPASDTETAGFMSDFYRHLVSEPDIAKALFSTRKSRISAENSTNFGSWAGFQLFIR